MPNVRASSGMIGTNLSPMTGSFMRSFRIRTNAIVVATDCLPDPFIMSWYTESGGCGSGLARTTRRGRTPPSAARRSFMYWISSESWPGW